MRDELNYVHACGGTFNSSAALLLAKHRSLGCRRPSAFLLPALLGRVHHQAFELADGKFKLTEGRRLWIKLGEMRRLCLVQYYADPGGCDRGPRRRYGEVRAKRSNLGPLSARPLGIAGRARGAPRNHIPCR
jgi:hypothetical protein